MKKNDIDPTIIIDPLIKEYNKLAAYTKQYSEPTLYDLLMTVITRDFEALEDQKANIVIGSLFLLLMNLHQVEDQAYIEQGLRTLRVWSKHEEIYYFMLYIISNVFDNSKTPEETGPDDYQDLLAVSLEFLGFDSLDQIPEMPSKRPYKKLLEAQKKVSYDAELKQMVTEVCMDFYHFKGPRYLDVVYNLLLRVPFAHTAMTLFIEHPTIQDQIDLLTAMINAFEISHVQELSDPEEFNYDEHDNREYILALESLAYINKRQGKTKNALAIYRQILQYDEDDHLNIKHAILMPLLSLGMIEDFLMIRESLPEDSIYRVYLNLYDRLVGMEPFHQEYLEALNQSTIIMDLICSNDEFYGDATEEEQRFIEDFIPVFRHSPKYLKELISLHVTLES